MSKVTEQELKKLNKTLKDVLRLLQKQDRAKSRGFLTEPLIEFSPDSMDRLIEAISNVNHQEEE